MQEIKGAIFDLDGVIVDTAKFHYIAWKNLADKLGFNFTEKHNERLKGVSRVRSLEILLEIGGLTFTEEEQAVLREEKNDEYVALIKNIDESELLPGAKAYIEQLRANGVKIALGSASKNAGMILEGLNIIDLFDVIIDGNKVAKAKPDPEVFLKAAEGLGLAPDDCVVFEDAEAGIEAAKNAGMRTIGIGTKEQLPEADEVVTNLAMMLA
ncbi:beta-phosphoglucomutase [Enterococcus sp. PF1-24]|uniref:beta-phosphoglucomutase n=1 Tax=unclassified Enterococcus TaxID=2608891 RepID=UPI00247576BD|nr:MULTISPECIES: beta-phosphoglucomutase [unclassified Enterococcus]MDH6363998.1 beta-phosphoglucomutase [Enterococcus sp. PFB1-1]MDH6401099.1 beta-phosphoglucomutase [Enterococcus sp. PF1-24]